MTFISNKGVQRLLKLNVCKFIKQSASERHRHLQQHN